MIELLLPGIESAAPSRGCGERRVVCIESQDGLIRVGARTAWAAVEERKVFDVVGIGSRWLRSPSDDHGSQHASACTVPGDFGQSTERVSRFR